MKTKKADSGKPEENTNTENLTVVQPTVEELQNKVLELEARLNRQRGCGSISISGSATEGIETRYAMTQDQFNKLKNGTATKFRIYTSIGYLEDDYKANNYEKLKTALNLIQ